MIILILGVFGLVWGSFVNALVWRLHEQGRRTKKGNNRLSVVNGRSMCPHCKHELSATDLIPVGSWLWLKGKCRYCGKSIGLQYPLVEIVTAALFILSYIYWPVAWSGQEVVNFIIWLAIVVGFMALIVYDFRWMILPNKIVYPLIMLAGALAAFNLIIAKDAGLIIETGLSVLIAGGIFYLLFIVSDGRWIGGGDVKLGFLIGLVLMNPYLAFFVLLLASLLGTLVAVPGMLLNKLTTKSHIPFGPFLIIAAILLQLFGLSLIEWYKTVILLPA